MPTITAKPFNEEMQALLGELSSGYHAPELSKKDMSELPKDIYIIEEDEEMLGYAVIWECSNGNQLIRKAEKDYFKSDEMYIQKDFIIEVKNRTDFIFIEALDILKEHEGKGHAKFFMNWLKEKYPTKRMYVYSIDKSQNFWFKQDFEVLGTTSWMTFK